MLYAETHFRRLWNTRLQLFASLFHKRKFACLQLIKKYFKLFMIRKKFLPFSHFILLIPKFAFCSDYNECSSSPCTNGGVCSDGVNKYTCSCAAGYEGTNCDTSRQLALFTNISIWFCFPTRTHGDKHVSKCVVTSHMQTLTTFRVHVA